MPKWKAFKYHVGLLMKDRQRDPAIDQLAEFWFARQDRYLLVQRRVTDNVYEYFAIPRGESRRQVRTQLQAA